MINGPVWLMQPIPYFGESIPDDWIYEPKIDGWRMQIIRYDDGHVECWGRRLERKPNWSKKLKRIVNAAERKLPKGIVLDCELFSTRSRRFIPSLFAKKPKAKPIIYVFDVVFFDNEVVAPLHLHERKKILKELNLKPPFYLLRGRKLVDIAQNYKQSVARGSEGIVIKKIDSPYLIGKDAPIATHYWRKVK